MTGTNTVSADLEIETPEGGDSDLTGMCTTRRCVRHCDRV